MPSSSASSRPPSAITSTRRSRILYTIYRERARRAGVDLAPLDQAIEQHRLIERLSRELTDGEPDDDILAARLTVLIEQVRTHLDDEELGAADRRRGPDRRRHPAWSWAAGWSSATG